MLIEISLVKASARALLLAFSFGAGLAALPAAAQPVPHPVEPREFYIQSSLAYRELDRRDFDYLLLYVDDRLATGMAEITSVNNQGRLLHLDTNEQAWIPDVAVGYAFDPKYSERFGGMFRIEARGYAYETETQATQADTTPPASGFFVTDMNTSMPVEVGLFADLTRVDGNDNPDGTEGGFLSGGPNTNISLDIEETTAGVDLMVYLDSRVGAWELTRGAGFGYSLQDLDYELRFANFGSPYEYDFEIDAHHVLFKAEFAAGRLLIPGVTAFLNGSFGTGFVVADMETRQTGPCIGTCDLSTSPMPLLPTGTLNYDRTETLFSYDLRVGAGLTLNLWKLRISGMGGIVQANDAVLPVDRENGKSDTARNPGYFGWWLRAGVILAI